MSFVHALGGSVAHSAAEPLAVGLGVSSTASHTKPNAPTYTVDAINQFKAANRQKLRKMHEEKPTEKGEK